VVSSVTKELNLIFCDLFGRVRAHVAGTVYKTGGAFKFVPNVLDSVNGTATGYFVNAQNETGWDVLDIVTLSSATDADQAYAAGMLEGALTATQIYVHYLNLYDLFFATSPPTPALLSWMQTQDLWARQVRGDVTALP
jgi:hypothetical protein